MAIQNSDHLDMFSNLFLDSYNNKNYLQKAHQNYNIFFFFLYTEFVILLQKGAKPLYKTYASFDGWMEGWMDESIDG